MNSPPQLLAIITIAVFTICAPGEEESQKLLNRHMDFLRQKWQDEHIRAKIDSYLLFPSALKIMKSADSVVVYEGLPHQIQEREVFQKELAKTDEIAIGEYAFYPRPINLRNDTSDALRQLLNGKNEAFPCLAFIPYQGPKPCGGFHPDYAVRFKHENEVCEALLCLGCSEAIILHNMSLITCSLGGDWKALLSGYRIDRPLTTNEAQKQNKPPHDNP